MNTRIESELKDIVKKSKSKATVKVTQPSTDNLSAVVGGANWSDKNVSDINWLSRNEYKQGGISKFFK